MSGERSNMPVRGRSRRTGARIGSVVWMMNAAIAGRARSGRPTTAARARGSAAAARGEEPQEVEEEGARHRSSLSRSAGRRRSRCRCERASRPPRPRPRSRRSCPSTAPVRARSSRARSRSDRARSATNVGRAASASSTSRPTVIRPVTESAGRSRIAGRSRSRSAGSKPDFAASASTFTWSSTGYGRPGRISLASRSSRRGELERVDGLDDVEAARRPPRLVRLERPDEVPARRLAGRVARRGVQLDGLRRPLLDPVLAEASGTRPRSPRGFARPARSS